MARKRYISTEISIDKKVLELADSGFLAPLLYTWSIPHMDDWGRITGDTREFKALVCPGLEIMNKDVDEAINHIVKAKLWVRYEVDGKKCIAVANNENWFKHQSYISKDKRIDDYGSAFPRPPLNTEKHRETPKNAEEGRVTPQNPSSFSLSVSCSSSVPFKELTTTNAFELFDLEGFGDCEKEYEPLSKLVTDYGHLKVCEALKEASSENKKDLHHVRNKLELIGA